MKPASGPEPSRPRTNARFSELFKVQVRLALREPYGLLGLALPIGLLVVFWYIGVRNPGSVGSSGLTILELYIPTLLVISYGGLALYGMPTTLVRDREIGWLRRVSTTPVSPSRLLAGQLLLNLVIAAAATVIIIVLGAALFGAPLKIGLLFVGVAALAIVEIFSLGLVVTALAPTQQAAQYISGGLFFLLLFLSGLWIQPVLLSGASQAVFYYSPGGAAARALLYSIFNVAPPSTTIATMIVYTAVFALVSVRYFRWE